MSDSPKILSASCHPSLLERWLSWRLLVLTAVVLVILAPVLYRGWRLGQVPVTDDPFDVEEFLEQIPVADNAYFHIQQAGRELKPIPRADYEQYRAELEAGWDWDSRVLNNHLDNNRLALNTWLQATEKKQYQPPSKWTATESPDVPVSETQEFSRLARTQVQKFERLNRPVEAVPWIRAQLRFAHLIRQRGWAINYMVGAACFSEATRTVNDWADHPELSRQLIDKISEELELARALNPALSEVIKAECVSDSSLYGLWTVELSNELDGIRELAGMEALFQTDWRAWLEAEPEYTVRLFPHIARNHLLFIETDRRDRPPLINGDLFEDSSATSAQRGDLPAEALAKLIQSSYVLPRTNLGGILNTVDRDEARYRCLTVALAAQAYFRDHGEFPVDAKRLIPEYLDEIPDDLYSPTPAPLIYRRDGDGAVVYSRFVNEIDDGGIEVDYDERTTTGDLLDLGFRIRNPLERPLAAPKP